MDIQRIGRLISYGRRDGIEKVKSSGMISVCTNIAYLDSRTNVKKQREDSMVKSC